MTSPSDLEASLVHGLDDDIEEPFSSTTTTAFLDFCATLDPRREHRNVLTIERRLRREPDIGMLLDTNTDVLHAELVRFLRAKKGDIDAATDKAARYYRWTLHKRPDLIGDADIGPELDSGKVLYMGNDNDGRPVYLIRAALHYPPSNTKRGFRRQSTQDVLIAAVRFAMTQMQRGATSFCLVADMKGFGYSNIDTGILGALGSIFSKYFPCLLHRLYVINSPFFLRGFWKLIRPMVEEKWLGMLMFLSQPKHLLEFMDACEVPTVYGGDLTPDWKEWTSASKRAILDNREIDLHTFCCSYRGEMLELMQQLQLAKQDMGHKDGTVGLLEALQLKSNSATTATTIGMNAGEHIHTEP